MRILLTPIAAFLFIAAADEAEVPAPEAHNKDALVKELRDRVAKEQERVKSERALGLLPETSLAKLLKEPRAGLRTGCSDRLERTDEGSDGPVILGPAPLLRRGPNTPETPPLAIYAVDRRENGCGMMVMMGNPNDVRLLPDFSAEDHRLMPADQDAED